MDATEAASREQKLGTHLALFTSTSSRNVVVRDDNYFSPLTTTTFPHR
jgi:hypothetical protein